MTSANLYISPIFPKNNRWHLRYIPIGLVQSLSLMDFRIDLQEIPQKKYPSSILWKYEGKTMGNHSDSRDIPCPQKRNHTKVSEGIHCSPKDFFPNREKHYRMLNHEISARTTGWFFTTSQQKWNHHGDIPSILWSQWNPNHQSIDGKFIPSLSSPNQWKSEKTFPNE